MWPELAEIDSYFELDAIGSELWLTSSKKVGHWDGSAWTILDTPELMRLDRDSLIEATHDGVYIHDGTRMWTYQQCAP